MALVPASLDYSHQRWQVELAILAAEADAGADDREVALGNSGRVPLAAAAGPFHHPGIAPVAVAPQIAAGHAQRALEPLFGVAALPDRGELPGLLGRQVIGRAQLRGH